MFKITNGEDYSLEQIFAHQKAEGSVLRSAHVGNFNSPTLFLAQEGFPIILHEHIRGEAKIYEPAYIKIGGKKFLIADQPTLPLTHSFVSEEAEEKIRTLIGRDFQRPAQLHYQSLKKLFPKNIQLTSQLFFEQDPFFGQALEILSKQFPLLFANFVDKNGKVFNLAENQSGEHLIYFGEDGQQIKIDRRQIGELTYNYLKQTVEAITGNGQNPEGIVMKSSLYVLLSTLCEVYKGRNGAERYKPGQVEVIHFSGVEMINYLIKNKKQAEQNARELNTLYETIKERFVGLLPDDLLFELVTTDMLGKVVTSDEQAAEKINGLFMAHKKLTEIFAKRQQSRAGSADEIRQQITSWDDQTVKERVSELYKQIATLPSSIKKRISDAREVLSDFEANRKKILGTLISAEIAIKDTYAESKESDVEIAKIKDAISTASTEIQQTEIPQVSQYDVLESKSQLRFPEAARELSQRQLQEAWNYSMRESSEGTAKEIRSKDLRQPI